MWFAFNDCGVTWKTHLTWGRGLMWKLLWHWQLSTRGSLVGRGLHFWLGGVSGWRWRRIERRVGSLPRLAPPLQGPADGGRPVDCFFVTSVTCFLYPSIAASSFASFESSRSSRWGWREGGRGGEAQHRLPSRCKPDQLKTPFLQLKIHFHSNIPVSLILEQAVLQGDQLVHQHQDSWWQNCCEQLMLNCESAAKCLLIKWSSNS